VILVPSKLLLNQWNGIVHDFYPNVPILLAGGGNNWKENPHKRMFVSNIKKPRIIIATMSTASSDEFIQYIRQAREPILIADEAHRIGSPTHRKIVQSVLFKEKLGLSATPERLFDTEGDQIIKKNFGEEPVYELPIGGTVKLSKDDDELSPILGKFLTRYDYYFEIIHLTEDEQEEWDEWSNKIKRFVVSHPETRGIDGNSKSDSKKLELMFIQRARILKKASGKTRIAVKVLSEKYSENSRWIIYCEDEDQMNQIINIIKKEKPEITALAYHSNMSDDERERTLQFFERHPSVIVSIRCLDEGVDIPVVDGAIILASSTNPRQYIQRRGRVLRKAKGKRRATIVDVLVLPEEESDNLLPVVRSELSRAWNFAKNAENSEITHELWQIGKRYGSDLIMDEQLGLYEEETEV